MKPTASDVRTDYSTILGFLCLFLLATCYAGLAAAGLRLLHVSLSLTRMLPGF